MSRNTTIELLNETERLQLRMTWQLFLSENNAVVYGDGTGWQPGDPLAGPWGVTVNPIYDVRDDGNGLNAECVDCQVLWSGNDPCWICGKPKPEQFVRAGRYAQLSRQLLTDYIRMSELEDRARRITRIFNDFEEAALEAAAAINDMFATAMGDAYVTYAASDAEFTQNMYRAMGRMQGYRGWYQVIDEWSSAWAKPLSKTVQVTVDDVTIVIPREWRQTKTSPAPQADTSIIDYIVTQHQRRFPHFYRVSENTYDRRT